MNKKSTVLVFLVLCFVIYKFMETPIKEESRKIASSSEVQGVKSVVLKVQRQVASEEKTETLEPIITDPLKMSKKNLKLKIVEKFKSELLEAKRDDGFVYKKCKPNDYYIESCVKVCVDDLENAIACETKREPVEITTACRYDAVDCVESVRMEWEEEIVSKTSMTRSLEGVCVTMKKNCENPEESEDIPSSDLKTFLTPKEERKYENRVNGYKSFQLLVTEKDQEDYLNKFADCMLEDVPEIVSEESLPHYVAFEKLKKCMDTYFPVGADD